MRISRITRLALGAAAAALATGLCLWGAEHAADAERLSAEVGAFLGQVEAA